MKPPSQTILPWLQANLGKACLAPLTSTDHKALLVAVQAIDLHSTAWNAETLAIFAAAVRQMQPQCRHLAYHAIAHVMDWGHRPELWSKAGLEPLSNPGRCAFE